MNKTALARQALRSALSLRQSMGMKPWEALCAFDAAATLGVEVRFVAIPSMEGAYISHSRALILVTSLRPPGRRAFTCAHELGHHVFGHGSQIDELVNGDQLARRTEEFLADCFAGFFLMPKSAVTRGFGTRGWSPESASPGQVYSVACWLGVGYGTLAQHMAYSLRLISPEYCRRLLNTRLSNIRANLLGRTCPAGLVVVDDQWSDRAIDMSVSEVILAPRGVQSEGNCVKIVEELPSGVLFRGEKAGLGRLLISGREWAAYVRVARDGYTGLSKYRHLEDPDDE